MEQATQTKRKRKLQGVVVSNKMDKTAVVSVTYYRWNAKYKKQYAMTRRFKAHDAENEYQPGDEVMIEESRPLSKEKRWTIVKLIKRVEKKDTEDPAGNE